MKKCQNVELWCDYPLNALSTPENQKKKLVGKFLRVVEKITFIRYENEKNLWVLLKVN